MSRDETLGKDRGGASDRRSQIERLTAKTQQTFPDVPLTTVEELRKALTGDRVVLVDVRTPAERAVSVIPGAIDVDEFEARAAELEGSPVVTYCTIGYRSSSYAERLRHRGWDASNLGGSILAWTHAGGPLVDPAGQPTKRVHVAGKKWDLAAGDYDSVW